MESCVSEVPKKFLLTSEEIISCPRFSNYQSAFGKCNFIFHYICIFTNIKTKMRQNK